MFMQESGHLPLARQTVYSYLVVINANKIADNITIIYAKISREINDLLKYIVNNFQYISIK